MTTFDFNKVREFADGLNGKLDRCDHGEGDQCATIEKSLELYAECCCSFYITARNWARDVFTGKVAFDATTEQMWLAELERLYTRSMKLSGVIARFQAPCYTLDEGRHLTYALFWLDYLRDNWRTPRLAVGPSARRKLSPENIAKAKEKLASLPSLPKDWEPSNLDQRVRLHKIRSFHREQTARS
jgi:hypothetical protein